MSLDFFFKEYLDTSDGFIRVDVAVDTKTYEGKCITDQDLIHLQIFKVTPEEVRDFNEDFDVEDDEYKMEDKGHTFYVTSVDEGYSTYNPYNTFDFRNYNYDCTQLDDNNLTVEEAFEKIRDELICFLERYDLNALDQEDSDLSYEVSIYTDKEHQKYRELIENLIEDVKETQKLN